MVRLEGLGELKNPMTSSGIETAAIFRKFHTTQHIAAAQVACLLLWPP
jgi:hypothetical protein